MPDDDTYRGNKASLYFSGLIAFKHADGSGIYRIVGNVEGSAVVITAKEWLVRPKHFTSIGMEGTLGMTQKAIYGVVPLCRNGAFELRRGSDPDLNGMHDGAIPEIDLALADIDSARALVDPKIVTTVENGLALDPTIEVRRVAASKSSRNAENSLGRLFGGPGDNVLESLQGAGSEIRFVTFQIAGQGGSKKNARLFKKPDLETLTGDDGAASAADGADDGAGVGNNAPTDAGGSDGAPGFEDAGLSPEAIAEIQEQMKSLLGGQLAGQDVKFKVMSIDEVTKALGGGAADDDVDDADADADDDDDDEYDDDGYDDDGYDNDGYDDADLDDDHDWYEADGEGVGGGGDELSDAEYEAVLAEAMQDEDEAEFQELLEEAQLQATAQGKSKSKKSRKTGGDGSPTKSDKAVAQSMVKQLFKSAGRAEGVKGAKFDEKSMGEMLHDAVKMMAQQTQQHTAAQDKQKSEAIARQAQKLRLEETYNTYYTGQEDEPEK